jgi:hypothetical protein
VLREIAGHVLDFFGNKGFRPITILCGIQRRRKSQEKCRIEANGRNVLPHENRP